MIKTAKEYDANYVFVGALTLYGFGKKLYYRVLEKHFPKLLSKYRKLFKISAIQVENTSLNLRLNTRKVMGKLRTLLKYGYVEKPVKGKYVITSKGREAIA